MTHVYDSDHPRAEGEVGRTGVAIDSVEDMARLFEGIPLDRVSTSMTINATAAILLALYVAVARRRGIAEEALMDEAGVDQAVVMTYRDAVGPDDPATLYLRWGDPRQIGVTARCAF